MSPEAVNFLDVAERQLVEAGAALAADLYRFAAREAYNVALSATRAIIFEKTQEAPKTHSGARNQLSKLVHGGLGLPEGLLQYLASGYELKSDLDYGPVSPVSRAEAEQAVGAARVFLAAARTICG